MPIQTRYLFSAAMDVEPAKEAVFNEVYDQEHVPLITTVPGVIAAARFKKQELTMIIGGERKTIVIENVDLALSQSARQAGLIMEAWPMLQEKADLDVGEQLALLREVIRLSPGGGTRVNPLAPGPAVRHEHPEKTAMRRAATVLDLLAAVALGGFPNRATSI